MQCPRCGTENREDRASCWDCFAPLRQAAAKPPKEKVKEGRQVEPVQPIPEPPAVMPEAAPEPEPAAFELREVAEPVPEEAPVFELADEAPEREPIELESELVVPEPMPSFAELVEETPAQEKAEPEPEPELPPASGMGFILHELAEPEAEQEAAVPEPPVEEEAPLTAPVSEFDNTLAPQFLGAPDEEEDLGAHEPKVFDLGEVREVKPPDEEPVLESEADLSVHEPKVFDLGEAPEEEVSEPEPIDEQPSVHEPKVFDLGVFLKAPPEPTPAIEETPEDDERIFDLGAESEEEASAEEATLEPEERVFDLESAPKEEDEPGPDEHTSAADSASPPPSPSYIPELADPEAEEELPKVEVPELPVFDIEKIEEPSEAQQPPADTHPARHRARSPLPGFAVTIILLLVATWGFINAYPPPGAVAKSFITATDSLMAGDAAKLSKVVSAESQKDIAQVGQFFAPFKKRRLQVQIVPKAVVSRKIVGNTANVVVLTDFGIPNAVQAQGKLTVSLVKEGSIVRKLWKVDLKQTGRNWKTELPQLLQTSTNH